LVIAVSFFNDKLNKVNDCHFALVEVNSATANDIFLSIADVFKKILNINLKNCMGFASDNASVMMGNIGRVNPFSTGDVSIRFINRIRVPYTLFRLYLRPRVPYVYVRSHRMSPTLNLQLSLVAVALCKPSLRQIHRNICIYTALA
jgi:hypothetical protein